MSSEVAPAMSSKASKQQKSGGSGALVAAGIAGAIAVAGGVAFALLNKKPESKPAAPARSASKSTSSRTKTPAGSRSRTSRSSSTRASSKAAAAAAAAPAATEPTAAEAAPAEAAPAAAAAAAAPAPAAEAAAPAAQAAEAAAPAAEATEAAAAPAEPAAAAEAAPEAAPAAEPAAGEAVEEIDAAAAQQQAAENGVEEQIELAEGEELVYVNEEGQVVDEQGNLILDEEGNPMTLQDLEGGAEAQVELSEDEVRAEQLMMQAAAAWNQAQNQQLAERLMREALSLVTQGEARPVIVAEVASTLSDMLFAQQKFDDAKEVVNTALTAAESAGEMQLYMKLTNNMGAVLKKLGQAEEAKELHTKALGMAIEKFGKAHTFAALARGNLAESLEELGQTDEARALLTDAIGELQQEVAGCEEKQEQSKAEGAEEDEQAADERKRCVGAAARAQVELGRLEIKHKNFEAAQALLSEAMALCDKHFGPNAAESASVLAALANCYRQAGQLEKSVETFEQLFEVAVEHNGLQNQQTILLAKTISDLYDEMDQPAKGVPYAEKALGAMQQMLGMRVHPVLEPLFNQLIELKRKAGDVEGGEELRKAFLKGLAQLRGGMARQGANPILAAQQAQQQQAEQGKKKGSKKAGAKKK